MEKLLIAGFALAAMSTAAFAENTQKEQGQPVPKVERKVDVKGSKAVRLSDAELDRVIAGTAEVSNGNGQTIVLNPGAGIIFKINHNHLVCINCL
jgi:hypothetical protein